MSHLKSSSMSITLTRRDLEEMSFLCFIYLSFYLKKRKLLPCPSPSSSCASWSSSSWSSGQVVASCAPSRLKNSIWKFLRLFRCFWTERNISVWNVWLACLQDFQDFVCLAVRVFFMLKCDSGYCEHKTFRKLNIFIERGKPEHQMTHLWLVDWGLMTLP